MMCCALLGFGAFLAMLITTLNVVVAAGDLTVDACVFDEFAPGDFELRDSGTIQRSTLRRYPQSLSRHTSWSRCALLPTGESRDARRATVSPSRASAASEELFPRSADLPIINDAFAARSDYR